MESYCAPNSHPIYHLGRAVRSQQRVLNHNTGIACTATSALHFSPKRLSGVAIRRLYALSKVMLIASERSLAMSISIKCGSARRYTWEELLLSGSLLLRCLLTASQSCFIDGTKLLHRPMASATAWATRCSTTHGYVHTASRNSGAFSRHAGPQVWSISL